MDNRRGRSRADILVVVIIVVAMLALAAPFVLNRRNESRRLLCEQRQQTVALAMLEYELYFDAFPGYRNPSSLAAPEASGPTGWALPLAPVLGSDVIGEQGPYAEIHPDFRDPGAAPAENEIGILVCPEDISAGVSAEDDWMSFVVNCGMPDADNEPEDFRANGPFLDHYPPTDEVKYVSLGWLRQHDGAESTLMLSENVDSGGWTDSAEALVGFVWLDTFVNGHPAPQPELLLPINALIGRSDGSMRFARPSSLHGGGVNVAYCSGATQFLSEKTDYLIFAQMMSASDAGVARPGTGEPIGPPYGEAEALGENESSE